MNRFFKSIHRYAKKLNSSSKQLLSNLKNLDGWTYFTDDHVLVRIKNPEALDGVTLFSDSELSYPELQKLAPQEKRYPVTLRAGTLSKVAELTEAYKDQDQIVTLWLNEEDRFDFLNQFPTDLMEVRVVISIERTNEYE